MHSNKQQPSVLLVEDFDDSRFMLRKLLELSGYQVDEATNGRQAVELARERWPDLVLMDLSLPEIDGLEATRQIRGMRRLGQVPIIAITAHSPEDYYMPARRAGCDEFFTKPVDFDKLESTISRLISQRYEGSVGTAASAYSYGD
jgi:two-component system cell cycle response regulator DivK